MSVMKANELGRITISKDVFAWIVEDAFLQPECVGKIWPTAKGGRLLNRMLHFTDPEVMKSIRVYEEDSTLKIEFSVISRFGVSIRRVTQHAADYIADQIRAFLPDEALEITINIAGVRSKQVARRNTKTVYRYEADR